MVNSFANFYKNRLWRNEVELRKQERLRLKAIQERQTQKYQFIEVNVIFFVKLSNSFPTANGKNSWI